MTFLDHTEKLEVIKYLCEHKRTGTIDQLALKLGVSGRTTRRMIRQLRDQGYDITYNRHRYTYEISPLEKK